MYIYYFVYIGVCVCEYARVGVQDLIVGILPLMFLEDWCWLAGLARSRCLSSLGSLRVCGLTMLLRCDDTRRCAVYVCMYICVSV